MRTGGGAVDRATVRDLDLGLGAFLTPRDALALARALRLGVTAT